MVIVIVVGRTPEQSNTPFPAPLALAADTIRISDFAGAAACAECHAAQYAQWSQSTHGRAGGPPAGRVLREFDGTPIVFRDARVSPRRSGSNYRFDVEWEGDARSFAVEGVIGGAHLVGGGTQAFVWRHPDGSLRVLPFELEGEGKRWFCNTETRADQGWALIRAEMSIADCGDWPPARLLGSNPRYASCQQCHASQVTSAASDAQPLRTDVRSYAIDCESCHGPAKPHIEQMRAGSTELGLKPLATMSSSEALEVCFRCHALKDDLRPGFLAGARLGDHFSLKLATLGSNETFADGRTRTFAYQQSHLYSDCYRASGMTCGDCHEPHGQGYRDVMGGPVASRFDDQQCTACHPSKAAPSAHSKHRADTEASRCVTCHMPYQQQQSVGTQIKYGRSDHTIGLPRPATDSVATACARCHVERSADRLQQQVAQLWGEQKPRLADTAASSLTRYRTLAQQLMAAGRPDQGFSRAQRAQLMEWARNEDDDLAGLALATLHYGEGSRKGTRDFLSARLTALQARDGAVRARWAVALGFMADRLRALPDAQAAVITYLKALEVLPNDARTWSNLGYAYLDLQLLSDARAAFTRTSQIEPNNSLAWVNLGLAHARSGDEAAARNAYQQAIRVNPHEALAHFNLGNIAFREGNGGGALAHYQRAVAADVSLGAAWINMARVYVAQNDLPKARAALRKGVLFDRDNAEAQAALRALDGR